MFIPLQVNDANHGLSIQTFAANTRHLVTFIKKAGIQPVIVKESYTQIEGYPQFVACAGEIAQAMGVEVIDTYTPSRGRVDLLADYAHPNDAGHQLIFDQYKGWLTSKPVSGVDNQGALVKVSASACI